MREAQDLINIGAYQPGSNPRIDYAISMIEPVNAFLRQATNHEALYPDSVQQLVRLFPPGQEPA